MLSLNFIVVFEGSVMDSLRNAFRRILLILVPLTFVPACSAELPSNSNLLDKTLTEGIFRNMDANEVRFMKSVLLCGDPNTKGSVTWLEESYLKDVRANENLTVISNAVLIAFFYPAHRLPPDFDAGVIFANMDQLEAVRAPRESLESIIIARFPTAKRQSPHVSCRFIFWVASESQGAEPERVLAVSEEFELKAGQWRLVTVKRNSSK